MPIEIRHVSATEIDVLHLCANVEVAAFASSHVNPVVFPGPFPADSSEQRAKDLSSQLSDSSAHLLVAFDTDQTEGEQVVGWSKWEVYRDGLPKPKPRTWGPGINVEAANLMFGSIDGMRDRNMTGKPCVYLNLLVTHPKHQGRGIGVQLMSWGMQEAQRLEIPAFLESSEAGRRLYQKSGFQDIDAVVVSFEGYGLDRPFRSWAMVKNPSDK